jgi:hypothetical protein
MIPLNLNQDREDWKYKNSKITAHDIIFGLKKDIPHGCRRGELLKLVESFTKKSLHLSESLCWHTFLINFELQMDPNIPYGLGEININ